jgi:two-component system chemotaxis sensor kinase CheA
LRSLRIDASRLDGLAGLVDELVAAKTALMHLTAATQESRALVNARAALERVVADLHAGVTDLRLVDLGRLLGRFPRLARDIAEGLSKPVEVVLSGEALKLDKSVIEGLHEPLLHLVRNALDHGVEAPAARAAAGKPARARLDITARAEGDQVLVSVADDGQGLDVARIRQKAVERGIVSPDAAAALSDAEAAELIFTPGFSTAGAVSDLSGRGVGMDAVRTAVSRLGGRVSLDNRPGQGLAVSMSLPARVVLTRLLTVTAGGQRFAAPLDAVIELHQVAQSEITDIRDERAYVRRDTVIPLLRLADLLGLTGPADAPRFPALSVDVDGAPVGLQIEAVGERWEAPMRPLSGLLADYPGVLGTVTEGDGAVLLVLNLVELAA